MEKKAKHFLHQPTYPGGPKALGAFIASHLTYPEAALKARIEGTVLVEYDINHEGLVTDTRVLQSLGHGCDEEAVRVIRLLRFDVGKNRGVKVLFHKKTQIRFTLPKPATPPSPAAQVVQYHLTEPAGTPKSKQETTYSYTYTIDS
jgi:protein TonB